MGVYIEGLKRPEPIKDCTHRNFVDVRIFDDGTATIRTDESPFFKVYNVKSVPPHGDLIDKEELIKKMVNTPIKAIEDVDFDQAWFTRLADTACQFVDEVEQQVAVIPAEKEAKNGLEVVE